VPIDEHQRKRNNNKILIGYKIIAQILKEKFDWVNFKKLRNLIMIPKSSLYCVSGWKYTFTRINNENFFRNKSKKKYIYEYI